MEDIPTKQCSKCGRELPLSEFSKNKCTKDGVQYYCRECSRKFVRKWYEANLEKVKENNRKWQQVNHKTKKKNIIRKYFHLHTLIRFNGNANSLLLNHEYNNIKSKI